MHVVVWSSAVFRGAWVMGAQKPYKCPSMWPKWLCERCGVVCVGWIGLTVVKEYVGGCGGWVVGCGEVSGGVPV